MQWGIIKCCPLVVYPMSLIIQPSLCVNSYKQGAGNCIESTAGIFQLFLQWFLFSFMYVYTSRASHKLLNFITVWYSTLFIIHHT